MYKFKKNQPLYTKNKDGTIQKWYFYASYGVEFLVSTVPNAKYKNYKKRFDHNDIGTNIFLTRKEAAIS